jgi:hypothetical protein
MPSATLINLSSYSALFAKPISICSRRSILRSGSTTATTPKAGEESIERIALMYAGHDLNHISQIEAILGKSASA